MADLKALYQQAFDLYAAEDYPGSIAAYAQVIEADPSFGLAYHGLAEAHARNGDLDAAVAAIGKAIEVEPDEPLYHTSLSRFLQQQGKIQAAEDEAAAAARLASKGTLL